MSKLRLNVLANFLGQGWGALLQLAVVPIYIKLIGIEAYGLAGFCVALQSTVQIFDLGLGQTMTREFSRLSGTPGKLDDARDVLKTVGIIYWSVASLIAAAVFLAAPFLTEHVIKAQTLPKEMMRDAIMLIAIIIPLQWAINLRVGALMGLERQVLVNALRIVIATVFSGGAVLVLWLVSATVTAFFMWQMLVSIANLIIISIILSRVLPPALHKPRFNIDVLRRVRQFAAGVLSINLVSTIVTQIDKWLLVALLPLNIYGSYVLATTVANALYMFFVPVFNGFYPRFSVLVMQGGGDPLKKLYCLGTQVMAITVLPAAVTLSLFSREILMLWTRNPEVAAISAPVVTILAFGTALNGLMNIPYALHLAHGWTRLPLGINLIAMMFLVPAILVLTPIYGPVGAAVAWLGFNVIFAGFAVPLTHRRLFSVGEGGRVTTDTLLIAGAVLGVLGAARLVYPPGTQEAAQVLYIIGSYAVSVLVAGLFSAQIRGWMLARLRNIFNHGLTR